MHFSEPRRANCNIDNKKAAKEWDLQLVMAQTSDERTWSKKDLPAPGKNEKHATLRSSQAS